MRNALRSVTVIVTLTALAAAGAARALAQSTDVNVDGKVNRHDGAAIDPSIRPQAGETTGEVIDDPLPDFQYTVPPIDTNHGSAIPTGSVIITGPGAGLQHVHEYSTTALGTGDILTIAGGGTVMIHVTGDLTLDQCSVVVGADTRVVFFVDGETRFTFADIVVAAAGGSVQIQAQGDVLIRQSAIRAVAVANGTLTLRGDIDAIDMDDSLRSNKQEGTTGRLRILTIVEGD